MRIRNFASNEISTQLSWVHLDWNCNEGHKWCDARTTPFTLNLILIKSEIFVDASELIHQTMHFQSIFVSLHSTDARLPHSEWHVPSYSAHEWVALFYFGDNGSTNTLRRLVISSFWDMLRLVLTSWCRPDARSPAVPFPFGNLNAKERHDIAAAFAEISEIENGTSDSLVVG